MSTRHETGSPAARLAPRDASVLLAALAARSERGAPAPSTAALDLGAAEAAGAGLSALVDAGILDAEGSVDPALGGAIDALHAPVLRCTLTSTGVDDVRDHMTFTASGATAVLATLEDGDLELSTTLPAGLPGALARLTGLGPRPGSDEAAVTVPVTAEILDALLGEERRGRRAAAMRIGIAAPDRGPLAADLASGRWNAWRARTAWADTGDGTAGRDLTVLDTPHGLLLARPVGDGVELAPAQPSQVWRMLVRLLPLGG